jgi:pilus assembly protein Flp/PilA
MTMVFTYVATWLGALRARFVADETGATAVEYGIMVALIAAVIVSLVVTLGTQIENAFQTVIDALPTP